MSYHLRFSTRNKAWNADMVMHITHDKTLKTLCGRNASDWFEAKREDYNLSEEPYICDKCNAIHTKAKP